MYARIVIFLFINFVDKFHWWNLYLLCPTQGNSVKFKSYWNKLNIINNNRILSEKLKRKKERKKKKNLTSDKHGKQ